MFFFESPFEENHGSARTIEAMTKLEKENQKTQFFLTSFGRLIRLIWVHKTFTCKLACVNKKKTDKEAHNLKNRLLKLSENYNDEAV